MLFNKKRKKKERFNARAAMGDIADVMLHGSDKTLAILGVVAVALKEAERNGYL